MIIGLDNDLLFTRHQTHMLINNDLLLERLQR